MADRFKKEKRLEPLDAPYSGIVPPDTYFARVPTGGIPALQVGVVDVAGKASCQFYKIRMESGDPEMHPVVGLERNVHNLGVEAITSRYVVVNRDKHGHWFAGQSGGGSYYKHLGRFLLDEALAISSERVWGTMTDEYGEGITDIGRDEGPVAGTGSFGNHVILHNFLTHAAGVYEFYADAGD